VVARWATATLSSQGRSRQIGSPPAYDARIAVCDVDLRAGQSDTLERNTLDCASQDSLHTPGTITNQDWNGASYQGIQNIACGTGCTYDLRPEYINGLTDTMATGTELSTGDLAVSWDETHRVKHQVSDGNLVVYHGFGLSSDLVTWAASNCLTRVQPAPERHGDHAVRRHPGDLQRGRSAPVGRRQRCYNSCGVGSYITGGSPRIVMQSDGNLVIYNGTSALWSTGTNGK
jgi:hypothetical protein